MLRSYFLGLVGEAYRAEGKTRQALAFVDEALTVSQAIGEHFYDAELHRLRGEFLAEVDPGEARESLRHAVAVAQAQGARLLARRARESLRRLAAVASS